MSDDVNMSFEASKITFNAFSTILFGEDFVEKCKTSQFYDPNTGVTEEIGIHEATIKIADDQAE